MAALLAGTVAVATTAAYAGKVERVRPPPENKPAAGKRSTPGKVTYLFVLRSAGGTLRSRGGGRYELRLRGYERQSIAFADRPARKTAVVSTTVFLRSWRRQFKGSAPNVALVLPGGNPQRDTFVFELGVPTVDASSRSVSFPARVLKSAPSRFAYLRARVDPSPPRSFGAATLFVDDDSVNTSYCGAGIRNNSSYTLVSSPQAVGSSDYTIRDGGNGEVSSEVWPSSEIDAGETGSGGVAQSSEFYYGCEMTTIFHSLPLASDGFGVNGDIGIYVEYDYTGASQFECVATGALDISCRFVQAGDSTSAWVSAALTVAAGGVAGAGAAAVQLIAAASTGAVAVEATISTRGGSQFPVCQASAGHAGCPSLLGGDED